jgi:hypothetical protein
MSAKAKTIRLPARASADAAVAYLRSKAEVTPRYRGQCSGHFTASKQVLAATERLPAALAESDASVIRASRSLVKATQPRMRAGRP